MLAAAGVDTVKALRTRNAENWVQKMAEVNKQEMLTRQPPSGEIVKGCVQHANQLVPTITY